MIPRPQTRFTTAIDPLVPRFADCRIQQLMAFMYGVFWLYLAVDPTYRPQWLLENYLVFAFVTLLVFTYRKYPLSDLSYLMLTIFFSFHAVGAHYGYSSTPLGFWMHDVFQFVRPNPYDRLVHFLFGLLFAYPIHEVLTRYSPIRSVWLYVLPVDFILSYSAGYELIEATTAWTMPAEQYDPFVGLQGDIWDGFRDMGLALLGGTAAMLFLTILRVVTLRMIPRKKSKHKQNMSQP